MNRNKINSRSQAIKNCILKVAEIDDLKNTVSDMDKKLNRMLHRININKKLIEQNFANHGFVVNENVETDPLLNSFYEKNNNYKSRLD